MRQPERRRPVLRRSGNSVAESMFSISQCLGDHTCPQPQSIVLSSFVFSAVLTPTHRLVYGLIVIVIVIEA